MITPANPIPVIVVTGPVGAGKSTVGGVLTDTIGGRGIRAAFIDMDSLRWLHPNASGDRFSSGLGHRNLAAIWPNLLGAGVRCVVLADVVEEPAQAETYAGLMPGSTIAVVRLDVPLPLINERLRQRERTPEDLAWSAARAPELQDIMETAGIGDLVIDVGVRAPEDIVVEIIERLAVFAPPDAQ